MSLGLGTSADRPSLTADVDPTGPTAPAKGADRQHGRSPSQIAWDRLKGDKIAITSLGIVVFFVLVAVFAPLLVKLEGEELNVYHSDLI